MNKDLIKHELNFQLNYLPQPSSFILKDHRLPQDFHSQRNADLHVL